MLRPCDIAAFSLVASRLGLNKHTFHDSNVGLSHNPIRNFHDSNVRALDRCRSKDHSQTSCKGLQSHILSMTQGRERRLLPSLLWVEDIGHFGGQDVEQEHVQHVVPFLGASLQCDIHSPLQCLEILWEGFTDAEVFAGQLQAGLFYLKLVWRLLRASTFNDNAFAAFI